MDNVRWWCCSSTTRNLSNYAFHKLCWTFMTFIDTFISGNQHLKPALDNHFCSLQAVIFLLIIKTEKSIIIRQKRVQHNKATKDRWTVFQFCRSWTWCWRWKYAPQNFQRSTQSAEKSSNWHLITGVFEKGEVETTARGISGSEKFACIFQSHLSFGRTKSRLASRETTRLWGCQRTGCHVSLIYEF